MPRSPRVFSRSCVLSRLLGMQVADHRPLGPFGQGNRCAPACFNNGNYRGYSPRPFYRLAGPMTDQAGEATGSSHISPLRHPSRSDHAPITHLRASTSPTKNKTPGIIPPFIKRRIKSLYKRRTDHRTPPTRYSFECSSTARVRVHCHSRLEERNFRPILGHVYSRTFDDVSKNPGERTRQRLEFDSVADSRPSLPTRGIRKR